MAASVASVIVCVVVIVMHGASPQADGMATITPPADYANDFAADLMRVGPSMSKVIDAPGFLCKPMTESRAMNLDVTELGVAVVAIDSRGVIWGPSCLVDTGIAGS